MAIQMKDTATIAAKFASRAQAAGPEYASGVKAPRTDWAQATSAAGDNYEQGVTQAIGRKASNPPIWAGTPVSPSIRNPESRTRVHLRSSFGSAQDGVCG